jgi:hypothetical protein
MCRNGTIRLSALLLVITAGSVLAQSWIEYKPVGVGFRVEFPGKWVENAQDLTSGTTTIKVFTATYDLAQRGFVVRHNAIPAERMVSAPPDRILDDGRDFVLRNLKLQLRREDRMRMAGYPARQFVADFPDGQSVYICRIVLFRNTFIEVVAGGPKAVETDADTERFFRSFALTDPG